MFVEVPGASPPVTTDEVTGTARVASLWDCACSLIMASCFFVRTVSRVESSRSLVSSSCLFSHGALPSSRTNVQGLSM